MNVRKLLGCRPRVGDKIAAGMDFGVHFTGIVVEDHSNNPDIPHYIGSGIVHISNMWKGEIEQPDDNVVIPANRAKIA
jgi:hypothetical protein